MDPMKLLKKGVVEAMNKAKTEPLMYGYALFRYTQACDTVALEGGPTGSTVVQSLKDEIGEMIIDNLLDYASDVLTEVPFAGTAIKILKMIMG